MSDIQKDDILLPGDLGEVVNGHTGIKVKIVGSFSNDGATTITLAQVVDHYLNGIPVTEDADFEIVQPKQLPK